MDRLTLTLMPERLAVCRFDPDTAMPAWVFHRAAHFFCVMRTHAELSVVCPEEDLPPSVEQVEKPWRAFELLGPIPFSTTGVIASLVEPLAEASIPVFVLSTFDTDYILVKAEHVDRASEVLASRFTLRRPADLV